MLKNQQKIFKLFTHTDLDGVGCALVAKTYVNEEDDYSLNISYCENNTVDQQVREFLKFWEPLDGNKVTCYITDLSVNKETAELIDKSNLDVRLLDHHASAEWLNEYSWATVSVNQETVPLPTSGTLMFYCELYPVLTNPRLATFVHDVNNWDTWMWKSAGLRMPELYSTILRVKGRELFMEEIFPKLIASQLELPAGWNELMEKEEANKREYIAEMKNKAFEYEYEGDKYLALFASKYISELGNTLSEEHPQYAGVIMITEGRRSRLILPALPRITETAFLTSFTTT